MKVLRCCIALFAWWLVTITTHDAHAAELIVSVRGDRTAIEEAKLDELVRLELGAKAGSIESVSVEIVGRRAFVTLKMRDAQTRPGELALGAADVERTIALFIGELARDVAIPNKIDETKGAATTTPPPTAPTTSEQPSANTSVVDKTTNTTAPESSTSKSKLGPSFLVGGSARVVGIGSDSALVFGPWLEAGIGLSERVRVGVDARYGVAAADDPLGTVRAQMIGGGIHAAYRFVALKSLALDTGPRVGGFWIGGRGERAAGTAAGAHDSSSFAIDGAWFVETRWSITKPLVIGLGLEAGYLGPGLDLRADDRRVLRIAGAFAGGVIGVGLAP